MIIELISFVIVLCSKAFKFIISHIIYHVKHICDRQYDKENLINNIKGDLICIAINIMYNIIHTLFGAAFNLILALVIIPNCPRPPKTALNNSEFIFFEHVISSPFPVTKQGRRFHHI